MRPERPTEPHGCPVEHHNSPRLVAVLSIGLTVTVALLADALIRQDVWALAAGLGWGMATLVSLALWMDDLRSAERAATRPMDIGLESRQSR